MGYSKIGYNLDIQKHDREVFSGFEKQILDPPNNHCALSSKGATAGHSRGGTTVLGSNGTHLANFDEKVHKPQS
jgi:hypothetical protein